MTRGALRYAGAMIRRNKSGLVGRYEVTYLQLDGQRPDAAEVRTQIRDVIRWETNRKRSVMVEQSASAQLEVIYYALKREGLTDAPDFQAWIVLVDDIYTLVEVEDDDEREDEEEDPTGAGN